MRNKDEGGTKEEIVVAEIRKSARLLQFPLGLTKSMPLSDLGISADFCIRNFLKSCYFYFYLFFSLACFID